MAWKRPLPGFQAADQLPREALVCSACGYVMGQWPGDPTSWPLENGGGDDAGYQCPACLSDLQAVAPIAVMISEPRLDIETLIQAGEGQAVDFKDYGSVESTELQRDLAKHIAAFATGDGGVLLLGVRDDGAITGITGAETIPGRDRWRKAIFAASRAVKPAIVVAPDFVEATGQTVLAVRVPRGNEPVYYVANRPYVRDGQASRPAEPDEVKALYARPGRA